MNLPGSGTARLSRRRLLALTEAAGVAGLFAHLGPADAVQISPDDPRVQTASLTIENGAGGLQCYQASPATAAAKIGGVIICHDALGPTPHFQDIARRLAIERFSVLAPDFASHQRKIS